MSDHLEKAKAALDAAGKMEIEIGQDTLPKGFADLLNIATVQARVAQAEALDRIASLLEDQTKLGGAFRRTNEQ